MDFELSDEQELMRSGLRQLFEGVWDIRRVRNVAYEGDRRDPKLWRALAEAGWLAIAVPEAEGGAGRPFEDVLLVIEEAGRALAPLPISTTLLAARAVARAPGWAPRGALLSRIADGSVAVTLALQSDVERAAADAVASARDGKTWRLSGTVPFVPCGPLVDLALVEGSLPGGGRGLFAVETNAASVSWLDIKAMDRTTPQCEMTLDDVRVDEDAAVFGERNASAAIGDLLDEWRAALAAETLGAAEKLLELTVAYAKERVQFGRPIGANQAVKIRIAEMGAAVERMRAAVYHAAVKIDAGADDRALAVAMAKASTATDGSFVGTQAIHVHGGIGYTWEHDTHLYFKRIKSNELLLGDESVHIERIAQAVLV